MHAERKRIIMRIATLGSPVLQGHALPPFCAALSSVEYLEGAKGVRRTRTLYRFGVLRGVKLANSLRWLPSAKRGGGTRPWGKKGGVADARTSIGHPVPATEATLVPARAALAGRD